ncbi:major capsid protein [Myxococcus phage Mx1]|nr:major capsid protein [Myxococcus phage Mx1]
MANGLIEKLEELRKAMEAGNFNAKPSTLVQGSAMQIEDCSPVMVNVTFSDKTLKLQKMLSVKSAKSTYIQFLRRLSYGSFGGSAQLEGAVGSEQTGDYVRAGVPMAYYSEIRRVTAVASMVKTVTGEDPAELEHEAAALRLAGDIEFDLFRGKANFSNAGVFDGNPNVIPALANMMGLDTQIRQSDLQSNTQDLMFDAYGSGLSVVLNGGGILNQHHIEDAAVRAQMNHGSADKLLVDPLVLSAYNKLAWGKERIMLAGSPQDSTGADLRRQWVSGGTVQIEASRFLSGKFKPHRAKLTGPGAPTFTAALAASTTTFKAGQSYYYTVTTENEIGESPAAVPVLVTIANDGEQVNLTITPPVSTSRFFNVYRTAVGAPPEAARFIGSVINSGAATTVFADLGNKIPGFVTGFLVQDDTMEINELHSYATMKLAVTDLSEPTAHFRFLCLKVKEPRKNCLIDNLKGDF